MTALRPLAALLLVATLCPPPAARAVEAQWTPLGPYGGQISALAVAPGARRTVYAGTYYGGIFRSADAGVHWERLRAGLPQRIIYDLAVDPGNVLRVYAAIGPAFNQSGVQVSADGGLTWASGTGLVGTTVRQVAVDPADPERLFAASQKGLFESRDRGASWQPVSIPALDPPESPEIFAVRFDAAGSLWVLSPTKGLFRSRDGGASWEARSPVLPAGVTVIVFALDPSAPGTLYAESSATGADRIYRSTDGGGTWALRGAAGAQVSALAVAPDGSALYGGTGTGVRRSLDGGVTWQAPSSIFEGFPVQALAVPPSPPGVVYAGSAGLGVFKSGDHGASWQAASQGLDTFYVFDVAMASDSSLLYASVPPVGLMVSSNRGASWHPAPGGYASDIVLRLAVSPRNGRIAWGSIDAGRIVRTRDAGKTTDVVAIEGGSCMTPTGLAVNPRQPANLEAAGPLTTACERQHESGCLAFTSADGGTTWSCNEKPGSFFFTVAFDPVRKGTLYGAGLDGVAKTTDGGRTWTAANHGLPAGGFVTSLVASASGVLYAGAFPGVYRSRDGALTWKLASTGMPPAESIIRLAAAPSDPAVLYAATVNTAHLYTYSVYETSDAGTTWHRIAVPGLPPGGATSLAVDPRQPRTLYVGTGAGVYRLDR